MMGVSWISEALSDMIEAEELDGTMRVPVMMMLCWSGGLFGYGGKRFAIPPYE